MDEKPGVAEEINQIVKKSEEGDVETIKTVEKAYRPVLEGIKKTLGRINITVDRYVPESKFVRDKSVEKIVELLKKSKYCKEENGAYYIDLEPFGIHGRNTKFFFLRKDGTTLYATRDIAYHVWKNKKAETLINILGEDHKLESKQVEIALNLLGVKKTPCVIFYSFVSMPGGKMSTRRGRVVFFDDLINECVKRAYVEVKKRRKDLSEEKKWEIAELIGTAAVRYNIVKVQPEKDIVFKWEEALNFEGNAAPFIQYAYARASSILKKNEEDYKNFNPGLLNHESEIKLTLEIAELPLIVKEACETFKPHILTNYLFKLASSFNQFYRDCPVLTEKNKEKRKTRLALVQASKITLNNAMNILGIRAPEEM